MTQTLLRQLPSIDKWLSSEPGNALCTEFSHGEVAYVMREHLASLRKNLEKGLKKIPTLQSDEYFALLRADLFTRRRKSLRGTINATGIIIHTNLGRAPLAREALTTAPNAPPLVRCAAVDDLILALPTIRTLHQYLSPQDIGRDLPEYPYIIDRP